MSATFNIEEAIRQAIERTTREIADEEIAAAQQRIADRIAAQLGTLTMAIFKELDVSRNQQVITIRVRNDADKALRP